jgi:CDP-diacylglycerol--serine O-phosphatidyltransferase
VLIFASFGQDTEIAKHITVLAFVYLLAFLMISNIKYYSFKELNLSQRMPFRLLVALIFLLIAIAAEPPAMLFLLSFGYVLSGPVTTLLDRRRRKVKEAERKKQEQLGINHR